MYNAQGIFQHHFQCKKVCTILDKIQYYNCKELTQISANTDCTFKSTVFLQCMNFKTHALNASATCWARIMLTKIKGVKQNELKVIKHSLK